MADRIEDFEVNSPRWLSLENFEGEIWKPIDGFEDWYEISTCGRVRTKERRIYKKGKGGSTVYRDFHPHIMKAHDNGHGYLWVCMGGRMYVRRYIHRLVAVAFIPNKKDRNHIDHINTIKSDNRCANLRWVNRSENALNPITRVKNSISQSEAVVVLDCWGNFVCEYYGAQAAADALGIERSVIVDALSRRRSCKFAQGFQFIKKKDYDPSKDYKLSYKRGTSKYTNIPSDRMVLIFRDNKLYTVFPNTTFASEFYGVCASCISNQCRKNAKGIEPNRENAFNGDELYYFKDVSELTQEQALSMFKKKYNS